MLMLARAKRDMKSDCATGSRSDDADDFGRSFVRGCWFKMFGYGKPPPPMLHWAVVYAGVCWLSFALATASTGFSLPALWAWATDRPTAMFALLINSTRAFALLPQLHMSRKTGVVAPGLALWMAMFGLLDLVEVLDDGIFGTQLCFLVGDIMCLLLVSDFLYLFVKSRLRGSKAVPIPINYDI